MFFSKEKLYDLELRDKILLNIHYCLEAYKRTGDKSHLEHVKSLGEISKELKERIDNGDYSARDSWREKADMGLEKFST